MDKKSAALPQAGAKEKAEARTAFLLAVIFGGLIVAAIGGMLVFDMYGEQQAKIMNAPAEAAHR